MPQLQVFIENREVELTSTEESPVLISYNLEDENDSQKRSSAMAFDAEYPATLNNDQTFNTFRNPEVLDMSPDGRFRKARASRIVVDKVPVLVGKALLKNGTSTDKPEAYTVNHYGDNGDWMVDMRDYTLYDCLPTNVHRFDLYGGGGVGAAAPPYGIEDSWNFDGTDSTKTWVYAPVRYAEAFLNNDTNISLLQMRPSLFVYWIIQRAFAKLGYKIVSQFMDTPTFRRLVMPWTWGNFLGINSKLADLLKFRATGPKDGTAHTFDISGSPYGNSGGGSGIIRPGAIGADDFKLSSVAAPVGFDNYGVYTYDLTTGLWTWTYKEVGGNFGKITAYFGVTTSGFVSASWASFATVYMDVLKNGSVVQTFTCYDARPGATNTVNAGSITAPRSFTFNVSGLLVNDTVSVRFRYDYFKSYLGAFSISLLANFPSSPTDLVTTYELFRIAIEPGGSVDWRNFEQFKKYKFLDFLRGIFDIADIMVTTDPISKTVTMEPAHAAAVGGSTITGYFKANRLNWTDKQDTSELTETESFDELERDYIFQFKGDNNDGGLQVINKRYGFDLSAGKFRFNSRFKEGNQTFENRFFSPVVHLRMSQWANLTGGAGITPQIVAIVPENISNTSADESEGGFEPKLCYYKGVVSGSVGGVFRLNSFTYGGYPYMFAVNYQPGGENDIALTYNDQRINGQVVPGLLRRFYLQRMAIQDYGVRYKPWMMLDNRDISNWPHRERIVIGRTLYLLTNIDRWDPIKRVPVQCTMWKYVPIEVKHRNQVYPSSASVLGTLSPVPAPDMAYQQSFILTSDLPTFGS